MFGSFSFVSVALFYLMGMWKHFMELDRIVYSCSVNKMAILLLIIDDDFLHTF